MYIVGFSPVLHNIMFIRRVYSKGSSQFSILRGGCLSQDPWYMGSPVINDVIYGFKKRIVLLQPSLGSAQMLVILLYRNQSGHGFPAFGDEDLLFTIGHFAD